MVQTMQVRDANGAIKTVAVAKGTGESTDPYYLRASAPISYPAGVIVVTVSNIIGVLVAAKSDRRSLTIQNRGEAIDIFIGATGGSFGTGLYLGKNDSYEISGDSIHFEEVRAIAEAGTSNVVVLEGI
jgi:hypothetical protein